MARGGWPRLSQDYRGAARAYSLDVAAALMLFVAASLMAGRIWRFPFDDELLVLGSNESHASLLHLIGYYVTAGDIHPPFSFAAYYVLGGLGLSDAGLRLFSVAMTGGALALFHVMTLTLLTARHGGAVPALSRSVAIATFGLCALAVSQGDAIRWYPLFALLSALCITFYLYGENTVARFVSASALGLAASTNFIAILVAVPLAMFRYVLQRHRGWRDDVLPILTVAVFALPGLMSASSIVARRLMGVAQSEFGNGVLIAVASHILGFFGGASLGAGLAWVVVPAMVVAVLAVADAIDRRQPASPLHLLVLLLAASAPMVFGGFAKPRSFLYLAPVLGVLVTLYLDRLAMRRTVLAAAGAAASIAVSVTAIVNVNASIHPFKRGAVIPYEAVIEFITAREQGRVLVVSSEPVVPWMLSHPPHPRRCVSNFLRNRNCFAADAVYDTVFVLSGHSDRAGHERFMRQYAAELARMTRGKAITARMTAGYDADASLKQRLTGTPLDPVIMTIELYR